MIKAASLPIDVDLLAFSQALTHQGVRHRIIEESGRQVIWTPTESESRMVRDALAQWSELEREQQAPEPTRQPLFRPGRMLNAFVREVWLCPITISLMLACALVAVLSRLGMQVWRVDFLFYPLLAPDSLGALLGDIVNPVLMARTLTPMFLHFGELHLVFNMLWLWYFGRQLEPRRPRWLYPAAILFTSFTANTAQYLLGGGNNFGGMSGVVYGLLGFAWVMQKMLPGGRPILSDQMFMVFVFMLVAMELLASSWIATAAHIGGLLAGLFLGIVVAAAMRRRGNARGGGLDN
ncbi:MAG: rhomboid family intramembrane serine protease [Gammaproteobacteria bacterium]|nr:rhomboid family intramembrane serine protease [Gammaproteobacteria bacterium]MYH45451.1 rhomboid family intramembrane serine protease [Gammaproteobacteria bacterium]MYL14862.1 rhomboid family intramembrane serine protease [Gammaproteobacteria bacterium]